MSMLKSAGKAATKDTDNRNYQYETMGQHGPFVVKGLDGEGKVIEILAAAAGGVTLARGSSRRIKVSEMRLALQVLEVLAVPDDAPPEHLALRDYLRAAVAQCPGLAAVLG